MTISVKNGKSIAAEWKIFPWEFARPLGLCNAEFSLSIVVGPRNFKLTEAPGKRQKQVQILFEGMRIPPKLRRILRDNVPVKMSLKAKIKEIRH